MVSRAETADPIEMPRDVVYCCSCNVECMSVFLLDITTRPAKMAKSICYLLIAVC